ncbi:GbsR/MarR family transcriptional regulator [Brevibacterium picturae]|uniref:Siderophore transport transcriptional regulator MmpR5 n=1 Tax=Brevibacterium picturae TaxID=260553 RepID=A0ABN2C3H9_9MICO
MPSNEKREFVEQFGLFFERAGGTRTAGRMFGWLLICDPPHQSISELTDALQVSKGSVSTVARGMEEAGFLERVPQPGSRQHYYRIKAEGWTAIVRARMGFLSAGSDLARRGLEVVGPDSRRQQRLRDWGGFLDFMAEEINEITHRWERHQRGEDS